jgi:SAM-dependent methyltransferase
MAAVAARYGVSSEVAAFEDWDPAARTFDRVTCAQAWHWLDPEVRAEKSASLLRPGGMLCLFWSVGHYPDDLAVALHDAYQRALPPGSPSLVIGYGTNRAGNPAADIGAVADDLRAHPGLAEPRMSSFPWHRTYSRDQWLDELGSHSDHAALALDLRETLFDAIGKTVDRFGGTFRMEYISILISASRA